MTARMTLTDGTTPVLVKEARIAPGRVERTVLGDPAHQQPQRDGEGDHHEGAGREHHQQQPAPHRSGASSFTPTPRTVCR